MAILVETNEYFLINATDLSDHLEEASIQIDVAEIDATAMSSGSYMSYLGGLKKFTVHVVLQQDYASSKVDATLFPLLGTTASFEIKAVNATRTATNPSYLGSLVISKYSAVAGKVGDLAKTDATWIGTGALSRATV